MVYRLLALDIDGTLLGSNNRLDKETKEAVAYAKEKGVAVTLVSERHFHSAAKVAKALKIDNPIITHNGAFASDAIDEPIYTNKIDYEIVKQLVEFLETYPCQIRVSHERLAVSNKPKQKNLIAKMTVGLNESPFYPVTYVDSLSEYLMDHRDDATELSLTLYNEDKEDITMAINDYFPEIHVQAEDDYNLTLTQLGTSKYNALVYLAQHLGFSLSETVAVGNDYNDTEMIAKAGLGVAMQNAPKEVKDAAEWVTRSNDMNGVGYMVKEVFRKQMRKQI
ncbi:Cof-type HAD-IIB family hydrolase [Tuberibacillus sp. Marseille-P3662]|uniref:Cof-type HAD-IIB family hydrolase n=1 Tax=Tuberibacillus sp. Marseille-P3662 TaxID=1965358 RepID=UPI000A1CA59E|nr:Cof-type HAD-IIB family hydrolase [Tuberibacillus sp. Marseille-P3662]